jgi:hypothetical protein
MSDLDQRQPLQTTRPLRKVRQLQASASEAKITIARKAREKSFFIAEKFFFVVPWAYVNKRWGTRA